MKRGLVAFLIAGAAVVAACGSDGEPKELVGSKVRLKSGESLAGAQVCGVDQAQCPSGLSCVTIPLEGAEDTRAYCVNEQAVCEQLECTQEECAVLESYPARVTCMSSSDSSPGGDDPISGP
ncbi:MAG TPA: hypothetical protein VF815_27375 [Myxococcaceae bacterium]